MLFTPGRTVLHRSWRGGRITFLQATRVVADDHRGLSLWLPLGSSCWRVVAPDGRTHHDAPVDELGPHARLVEFVWSGYHVLIWKAPPAAVSVWWFFGADATFAGWYVNLEEPSVRWDDGVVAGVDYADQALDIVVAPDRSWRWKDAEEFAARTGHPLYWAGAEADEIRAEGEQMIARIGAGAFPFDGTWCDFRPDPSWPMPVRPPGWDRPRA